MRRIHLNDNSDKYIEGQVTVEKMPFYNLVCIVTEISNPSNAELGFFFYTKKGNICLNKDALTKEVDSYLEHSLEPKNKKEKFMQILLEEQFGSGIKKGDVMNYAMHYTYFRGNGARDIINGNITDAVVKQTINNLRGIINEEKYEFYRPVKIIKELCSDFAYGFKDKFFLFEYLRKIDLKESMKTTAVALGLELNELKEDNKIEDLPKLLRIDTMLNYYKNKNNKELSDLQWQYITFQNINLNNLGLRGHDFVENDLKNCTDSIKKNINELLSKSF